ncbi:MAG: hypothetical protein S0880_14000 [Actinomycetota bacterium]|nr:hypothetical protein [Actinomycetota bacterium]
MRAPMNVAWLRLRTSESVAAGLLLTGQDADGAELARLGLATEVVDDAGVVERAHELARTSWRRGSPRCPTVRRHG